MRLADENVTVVIASVNGKYVHEKVLYFVTPVCTEMTSATFKCKRSTIRDYLFQLSWLVPDTSNCFTFISKAGFQVLFWRAERTITGCCQINLRTSHDVWCCLL